MPSCATSNELLVNNPTNPAMQTRANSMKLLASHCPHHNHNPKWPSHPIKTHSNSHLNSSMDARLGIDRAINPSSSGPYNTATTRRRVCTWCTNYPSRTVLMKTLSSYPNSYDHVNVSGPYLYRQKIHIQING